ncbi:MAG: sulfatase [Candidatus Hydrogenedentes bacterium]|nr:sulfatase [Candidatus Hydrogenedentota bacterium]
MARPNIILLVTDDQRWDAMSCMGRPVIQTPSLDRLAGEGVLFENNFCTTSICCSSRATIFTGLYTRCHGIVDFGTPLSDEQFALSYPGLLHEAGYLTAFVGKWGLGGPLPGEQFDFWTGYSGQGRYFAKDDDGSPHLTRRMGDDVEHFLRTCGSKYPFCLSVSFKAPHVQDQDPRQYLYDPAFGDLYKDDAIPVPKTASPEYFEALPPLLRDSEARRRWEMRFSTPEKYQESVKGYYRLINGVDAVVGRMLATLAELGYDENTVIVYTSDNGMYLGERGLAGKWFMHEESIRVPLIIRDPRLPHGRRGARRAQMTLTNDLMPTILDLAGVDAPANLQGRSLRPLLERGRVPWRSDWFYEHPFEHARIPRSEGVRTERESYARYLDTDPLYEELYDLAKDPDETRNQAADPAHAPAVDALRGRWQAWRDALAAWRPDPAAAWAEPT